MEARVERIIEELKKYSEIAGRLPNMHDYWAALSSFANTCKINLSTSAMKLLTPSKMREESAYSKRFGNWRKDNAPKLTGTAVIDYNFIPNQVIIVSDYESVKDKIDAHIRTIREADNPFAELDNIEGLSEEVHPVWVPRVYDANKYKSSEIITFKDILNDSNLFKYFAGMIAKVDSKTRKIDADDEDKVKYVLGALKIDINSDVNGICYLKPSVKSSETNIVPISKGIVSIVNGLEYNESVTQPDKTVYHLALRTDGNKMTIFMIPEDQIEKIRFPLDRVEYLKRKRK